VELEIDNGENRAINDLLGNWDLDLDEARPQSELSATNGRQPPRFVHKVLFSMPAGTPPAKVFTTVQNLCREEFALKHRYAMASHTDEPHPHVHVVIKAISEQGVRLNIRNAIRRQSRSDFVRHLSALGVPADATQRFDRADTTPRNSDGLYRAALRGERTHMRDRAESVARELAGGAMRIVRGKTKLIETRADVCVASQTVNDIVVRQRQPELPSKSYSLCIGCRRRKPRRNRSQRSWFGLSQRCKLEVATRRFANTQIPPSWRRRAAKLRAQFASRVEDADHSTQGMWNQKAVNQHL
jgi:Relaxase/Mobilisation nuclease domain